MEDLASFQAALKQDDPIRFELIINQVGIMTHTSMSSKHKDPSVKNYATALTRPVSESKLRTRTMVLTEGLVDCILLTTMGNHLNYKTPIRTATLSY